MQGIIFFAVLLRSDRPKKKQWHLIKRSSLEAVHLLYLQFFLLFFFFCFFVVFFVSVELECVQRPPIFSKWAIIMKNVQNRKTVYACTTVAFINDAAKK